MLFLCRVGIETEITNAAIDNGALHEMDMLRLAIDTSDWGACTANEDIYAAVASRTGLPQWSGSYTSDYGGEFHLCVERSSGVAYGVYSEYGFATGMVTGRLFEGAVAATLSTAGHTTQHSWLLPVRLSRHMDRTAELSERISVDRAVHHHSKCERQPVLWHMGLPRAHHLA